MSEIHRRRFLTQTAAIAALPMLSSIGSAQVPGRKLGVALCGLGSLSTNQIAPALQKSRFCRLAGIVTGTPSKAAEWQKKYGLPDKSIYNYQTMQQMASNPDIDVCLSGPRDERELDEALLAVEKGPLDADEMARVRAIGKAVRDAHAAKQSTSKISALDFFDRAARFSLCAPKQISASTSPPA